MTTRLTIKMSHVRSAGMCARGAREFFTRHGLNWEEFLSQGIDSEIILATGDVMAKKVVEVASKWAEVQSHK